MDGPGGHHPEWGNTFTKELTQYVLTDKWILAQNLGYPRYKIQFPKHMKLKKNEDWSVDTMPLLRSGNKTPLEGVTGTKFWNETIQRLTYPGFHPIYNHQTQTLLHMPERVCWQDPDIAISCEAMPEPGIIQKWMLTVIYRMEHRAPNGGARESTQGAKGICNPIGGTTLWTNQYPGALDSSCICIKRWPSWPSLEREAHWTCKLYMP